MRILSLLMLIGLLSACGTSREKWIANHCGPEASYEMGKKDAKDSIKNGRLALKKKCPSSTVETAVSSYEKGYKEVAGKLPSSKDTASGQDVLEFMEDQTKPNKKSKKSK